MSSTNFSVGYMEGRNSSRVLKPPGGGHSQIFGAPEEPKPKINASKRGGGMSDIFAEEKPEPKKTEEISTEDVTVKNNENTENGTKTEEAKETNGNEETDNKTNENGHNNKETASVVEKPAPVPTPQRQRVPPGGFSSGGFW